MEDKKLDLDEINKLVDNMYENENTEVEVEVEVEETVAVPEENVAVDVAVGVAVEEEKPRAKRASKKEAVESTDHCIDATRYSVGSAMTNPAKGWLETFKENYEGKSELSKEIEPFLKKNYKGDVYLPWATMERLTYMCDAYAKFTNICSPVTGGLVHTDTIVNYNKNVQKNEIVSETTASMFSHTVKVALEFMGKVLIEDYPIQDSDYSAAKIYNQNLVNRAIQRAKAKVASRATGLGLRMYEGFDLQFESIDEPVKPTLPVEAPKTVVTPTKVEVSKPVEKAMEQVITPKEEVKPVQVIPTVATIADEPTMEVDGTANIPQEVTIEANGIVGEIITLIRTTPVEDINKALQRVNATLVKKYGYGLSTEDTDAVLINKISKFPNPEKFKTSIEGMINA